MTQLHRRFDFLSKRARQGVSLLWIIIAFPALILFLVFAVEIGNIWLARIELEQSLEANALAAVKQWAEGGGGDTEEARIVGNAFSIANPVRGVPLDLTDEILNTAFNLEDLNYDPSMPNDNAECVDITDYQEFIDHQEAVMIFGAIIQTENLTNRAESVIFNAAVTPSCSSGSVLVDAEGSGNLRNGFDNSWGVSYRATTASLAQNDPIVAIEIDLEPGAPTSFRFVEGQAALSPNDPDDYIIRYNIPGSILSQADNNFVLGRSVDVNFEYVGTDPMLPGDEYTPVLRITFDADMGANGLLPGERFRFGAEVRNGNGLLGEVGADAIAGTTEIRVYYQSDLSNPDIGYLFDDMTAGNEGGCRSRAISRDTLGPVTDARGQIHVVPHTLPIQDLPCPPSSGGGMGSNNGQSWVEVGGTSRRLPFAVRAQATIGVPSVVHSICGFNLGPWGVSARATAYYDCLKRDPKLIRVDVFQCDPPVTP